MSLVKKMRLTQVDGGMFVVVVDDGTVTVLVCVILTVPGTVFLVVVVVFGVVVDVA